MPHKGGLHLCQGYNVNIVEERYDTTSFLTPKQCKWLQIWGVINNEAFSFTQNSPY